MHARHSLTMRWITRILLIAVILLLLAAGAVQVVLWSDWPRREALSRLQQETGLVIEADSLSSGWRGRSELKEVRLRLALADAPFATVPNLRVNHTALIPMLLTGRMNIESISADQPHLLVEQDAAGSWNIQRVVEVIASQQRSSNSSSPLPQMTIRNGTIAITNRAGESMTLADTQMAGKPVGLLEWVFEVKADRVMQAHGRLAMTNGTPHEIRAQIADAQRFVSIVSGEQFDEPIDAQISWSGRVQQQSLTGRADIQSARVGDHAVKGIGDIVFRDGAVSIEPVKFTVTSAAWNQAAIGLSGGFITIDDGTIDLKNARLDAMGAQASIDGSLNMRSRAARVQTQWSGYDNDLRLSHRGSVTATAEWPDIGMQRLTLAVQTAGALPDAQWVSEFEAAASGPSWREMNGQILWQKLNAQAAQRQVDLSSLAATVNVNWPMVRIDHLALANATTDGVVTYDATTHEWSAALSMKKWTLPLTGDMMQLEPLDVSLNARGSPDRIECSALDLKSGAYELSASGTYLPQDETPLSWQGLVKKSFPAAADAGSAAEASAPAASFVEVLTQGNGSVQPLNLKLSGHVTGRMIPVGDGTIDCALPITGQVTPSRVDFHCEGGSTMDGTVDFRVTYSPQKDEIDVHLTARDLAIRQLASIAGLPGTIDGRGGATARVRMSTDDPRQFTITDGQWQIEEAATMAGPVALASGHLRATGGVFELTEIMLTSAGTEPGSIAANAAYRTGNQTFAADAQITNWPWVETNTSTALRISGPAVIQVHLATGAVSGKATASSTIELDGDRIGTARAEITADQRTLHIASLEGNIWDGSFTGAGSIAIDNITGSRGDVQWQNLDLSPLANCLPHADLLTGRCSGRAVVQPSQQARALGPMQFQIDIQPHETRSRSVEIGDVLIRGYAGPNLLIADDALFNIAGGHVHVWTRISMHGSDPFAHVTASIDRLDLNQIVHWIKPEQGEVPGRISGTVSGGGYLQPVGGSHRLFGQSDLILVESDLVNIKLFTLIHDALSLSIGDMQPHGEGRASVRLEGNMLELSRLEYFNRGSDVVAAVRIQDLRLGEQSPIVGLAVGAMRPLKKVSVPFFKDFDRAFKALQTGAASVHISGTLGQPEQKLVPFAEIAGAFERILTGSAN